MIALADGRSMYTLSRLRWDLIVVGGGITGAGVFREAARAGLRVLLLEANDFASGTSSRSSKLVHGGLQYLGRGHLRLALESTRERNRLLRSRPGLVTPLEFALPLFEGKSRLARLKLGVALTAYRAIGGGEHRLSRLPLPAGAEPVEPTPARSIRSFTRYVDARTDDARLVLRVIRDGVDAGGVACNYSPVSGLVRDGHGRACGVRAQDADGGRPVAVHARVVVNATGPWADGLRRGLGKPRVRLVRGSHLVIPWDRLPLRTAVVHLRPSDGCPVVMLPWEGVTLVGGTAVDHPGSPTAEPRISPDEVAHLLEDVHRIFPGACITRDDVQATFSGFRPVLDSGTDSPVLASRHDELWEEDGLITVTGGKLTTFRAMARRVLCRAGPALQLPARFPGLFGSEPEPDGQVEPAGEPDLAVRRLEARYGEEGAREILGGGRGNRLARELAWCARWEGVHHLDDLLLRRVRLGLLQPAGAIPRLPRLRHGLLEALGWSDIRWKYEVDRYAHLWQETIAVPMKGRRAIGSVNSVLAGRATPA
jgi:glycerol-3-phosphate dehydrogenase